MHASNIERSLALRVLLKEREQIIVLLAYHLHEQVHGLVVVVVAEPVERSVVDLLDWVDPLVQVDVAEPVVTQLIRVLVVILVIVVDEQLNYGLSRVVALLFGAVKAPHAEPVQWSHALRVWHLGHKVVAVEVSHLANEELDDYVEALLGGYVQNSPVHTVYGGQYVHLKLKDGVALLLSCVLVLVVGVEDTFHHGIDQFVIADGLVELINVPKVAHEATSLFCLNLGLLDHTTSDFAHTVFAAVSVASAKHVLDSGLFLAFRGKGLLNLVLLLLLELVQSPFVVGLTLLRSHVLELERVLKEVDDV